jgi:hypothetical protein
VDAAVTVDARSVAMPWGRMKLRGGIWNCRIPGVMKLKDRLSMARVPLDSTRAGPPRLGAVLASSETLQIGHVVLDPLRAWEWFHRIKHER